MSFNRTTVYVRGDSGNSWSRRRERTTLVLVYRDGLLSEERHGRQENTGEYLHEKEIPWFHRLGMTDLNISVLRVLETVLHEISVRVTRSWLTDHSLRPTTERGRCIYKYTISSERMKYRRGCPGSTENESGGTETNRS